jgi:predicted N-acetyltransferase YhbS
MYPYVVLLAPLTVNPLLTGELIAAAVAEDALARAVTLHW